MASLRSLKSEIYGREERKQHYQSQIGGLNAYDRHKKFIKDYVEIYGRKGGGNLTLPMKTDQDSLREGYRFIPSEEDNMDSSWEKRLVKRYYDKLFKEYCIADMSQYKKGKIGLRWRTEKEVMSGKGQFACGNRECNEKDGLGSYEVNFSYIEACESKQALVKLVACNGCAEKMVYRKRKGEDAANRKEQHAKKRKKSSKGDDSSSDDHGRCDKRKKRHDSTSCKGGVGDEDENFEEFLEGMFP